MKQILRRCAAGWAVGVLLAFLLPGAASAEPVSGPRTVDVPLFTESKVLNLPRNTASFWFSVPGGTVLSAAQLRLYLSVSDTLIDERSSITLLVNGEALETAPLTDIAGTLGGLWTVDIPIPLLRTDGALNELTFQTAQRSIEGDCADIDNPSNWTKLRDDSALRLTVAGEGDFLLSSAFPFFYDTLENAGTLQTEYVVGASPSAEALAAAMKLAAAAGGAYPYRDTILARVSADGGSSLILNKIYLGTEAFQSNPSLFYVPGLAPGEGYLQAARSGGYNRLLIAGGDETGFGRAVNLAANRSLLAAADTTALTIAHDVRANAAVSPLRQSGYYTLSDFGYGTVNLAGAFHQEVTYTITQPGGLMSGGNSYAEIHYRHSEALIADNSLMTVSINNNPVGSARLSASNASGGSLRVTIPEEALSGEDILLKVEVYNYLGRLDCSKDYYDTAWTAIDADSSIFLEPGERAVRPTLKSFMRLSPDSARTIIALPEGASAQTHSLAATLSVRAGQASGGAGEFRIADIGALKSAESDADYIILADNERADFPDELKNALTVYPEGGGVFHVGDADILPELLNGKIVFQVARSPWNFDRRVYVVTYPQGMESAAAALAGDRSVLSALSGQAACVSADGTVYALASAEEPGADSPPMTLRRAVYLIETKTGYSVWVLLLIAAALIVILALAVRSFRNKARFKAAEEDVKAQNQREHPPKEPEDRQDGPDGQS